MCAALGISDEKHLQINDDTQVRFQKYLSEHPEYEEMLFEIDRFSVSDNDPIAQKKFLDLMEKSINISCAISLDAVENALEPDQKQRIRETLLASMSELPIVILDTFEALGLTDAQKQQMEKIKKELEPEFEKLLDNYIDRQMFLENKRIDELVKQKVKLVETSKMTPVILKKLMTEDPEYKKIYDDIRAQGRAFATQFKVKLFDVLTDEQWARLQNLINNPPEHAKAYLKKMKEQREEAETAGGWQPGPNSWRPGDPIPEEYRQERNKRRTFPRAED